LRTFQRVLCGKDDMDRYTVSCVKCEGEWGATMIEDGLWRCNNCGYFYDAESARITNETEKEHYHELYIGAKIAGMIDEPDVPREIQKEYYEAMRLEANDMTRHWIRIGRIVVVD